VFTRGQALDEGATIDEVRGFLESRTWVRVLGRAVAHRSLAARLPSRAWAAVLTVPSGVVVRSAGLEVKEFHGLLVTGLKATAIDCLAHTPLPDAERLLA